MRATGWPPNRKTVIWTADLLGYVAFLVAIPVPWEVAMYPSGHLVFLRVLGFGWLCVFLVGAVKQAANTKRVEAA